MAVYSLSRTLSARDSNNISLNNESVSLAEGRLAEQTNKQAAERVRATTHQPAHATFKGSRSPESTSEQAGKQATLFLLFTCNRFCSCASDGSREPLRLLLDLL